MHLAKQRVVRLTKNEIQTAEGDAYLADVLIYATGFMTQRWLFPVEIKGRGGEDLSKAWESAGGAEAYKGTVVTNFPNLFILYGPNAATGQHSVIFHSECQINYSCRLLKPVLRGNADSITVTPEAQKRDLAWVHENLRHLVFNAGYTSWWMDPKTGKNTFIYPDPMFKYWMRTIFPTWGDFDIEKGGMRVRRRAGSLLTQLGLLATVGSVVAMTIIDQRQEKSAGGYMQTVVDFGRRFYASFPTLS